MTKTELRILRFNGNHKITFLRLLEKHSNIYFNLFIPNKMKKEIPQEIQNALDKAAQKYSQSEATTNAGRVLRFIAGIVPASTIIKLFAHKLS